MSAGKILYPDEAYRRKMYEKVVKVVYSEGCVQWNIFDMRLKKFSLTWIETCIFLMIQRKIKSLQSIWKQSIFL